MLNSDALYRLIHTLSPSEKRYFKIFSARYTGEEQHKYVGLFDIMEQTTLEQAYFKKKGKGRIYEESIFLTSKNIQNKRDLAVQKNILYTQILRSLRSYRENKSAKIQLRNFLTEIDLLIEKDLIHQALKRLKIAKNLAMKYQYELILYELILTERQIIRRFQTKNISEQLQALAIECSKCLKEINQQQEMLDIYEPLHIELRNKKSIKSEEIQLMLKKGADILQTFKEKIHLPIFLFNTKIIYYRLSYNHSYINKNYLLAQDALQQIVYIYENHKKMIVEQPERYIRILHNFINTCISAKKYEEIQTNITKMQQVILAKKSGGLGVKDFHIRLQVFKTTSFSLLRYYLLQEDFDAAFVLIKKIRKELKEYETHLPVAWLIPFYHNISMTLFLRQQYADALFWTNKVAMMENKNVKIGIQLFSRILHVILNYEVGNHALTANSLIPSLRRELNKKEASVALRAYIPEFVLLLKAIKKACKSYQKSYIFQRLYDDLLPKWNGPEFKEILEWIHAQASKKL